MRKLKILVNCPGSWVSGLDSPERGEGRWCQNWAKTLAKYGHEVYASSAGMPDVPISYGVTLLPDRGVHHLNDLDVYVDAAWWDKKPQPVLGKYNFHVHWGLEDYLLKPGFPEGHAIIYPYKVTSSNFICERNPYVDRTFFLPVPLKDEFDAPAFDRKDVLFPAQASPSAPVRMDNAIIAVNKAYSYMQDNPSMKAHWLFWDKLTDSPHIEAAVRQEQNTVGYSRMPYKSVVDVISKCKLSFTLNSPSCIIDAAVQGVPYLPWEYGCFFTEPAKELGILIGQYDETRERIEEVIDILMTDRDIYTKYVLALQDVLSEHTEKKAMALFNQAIERLGG